jgi:DNA-directed RNA polymerase specialized sigma subunit
MYTEDMRCMRVWGRCYLNMNLEKQLKSSQDTLHSQETPNIDFIRGIAFKLRTVTAMSMEDLVGWGLVGFYEALEKWDEKKGPIKTFSFLHIRGRMIDAIRKEQGRHGRLIIFSLEGLMPDEREKALKQDIEMNDEEVKDVIRKLPFGDLVVLIAY